MLLARKDWQYFGVKNIKVESLTKILDEDEFKKRAILTPGELVNYLIDRVIDKYIDKC